MKNKSFYKISEFAEQIGVTEQTLRNWEKEGLLIPQRTPGGWRQYTHKQLEQYKDMNYTEELTETKDVSAFQVNIRLKQSDDEYIVQIQHLITKEFVDIKNAKTYKTANAQLNKHKQYLEEFGVKVNVLKYKDKQGGSNNEL